MENENIYKKIFILQQNIAMAKDKAAKNYIYRTLDDMLLYLKPYLNDLKMIAIFNSGTIEGNVKKIALTLYNIDNPEELFTIADSCIVDPNPKIMSPAQSSNATDTFLQKRILEHLLLLTTEPDPDGLDWEKEKETNKSQLLYNILNNAAKAKLGTIESLLQENTTFGDFKGYTDILKVSDKVEANLLKKVSDEQIKRLMTIAGNKKVNDSQIKVFIHKIWGKVSKKDLTNLEYNILCKYLEGKNEKA